MTESFGFNRKCLVEIRVGKNHDKVHPAWQDDTNEGFLICYDLNLVFDDQSIFLVQPCEVEIMGRYPGLGLSLKAKTNKTVTQKQIRQSLEEKNLRIVTLISTDIIF